MKSVPTPNGAKTDAHGRQDGASFLCPANSPLHGEFNWGEHNPVVGQFPHIFLRERGKLPPAVPLVRAGAVVRPAAPCRRAVRG
eukprot:gene15224-biopygen9702